MKLEEITIQLRNIFFPVVDRGHRDRQTVGNYSDYNNKYKNEEITHML